MNQKRNTCIVIALMIFGVLTANNVSGQACVPAPLGVVSWWAAEANARDWKFVHNGTLQNGTSFSRGRAGRGFHFDGQDDWVDLGNWFDLQIFTIEMWVKPGASQVQHADILDNNHTDFRSWVIQSTNIGSQFFYGSNDGSMASLPFDLAPDVWQHLVITRDAGNVSRGYLNNVLIGTITGTRNITYDGTQFLRLANWSAGGRYFNGDIDEVTIYNRSLPASEVATLYAAGSAAKCATASMRADFDGDRMSDLSVFRPSEGRWYLNRSGSGFNAINWGISTDAAVPGDFDADGNADTAIFRPSAGIGVADFYVLNSNGFTVTGFEWGFPDDIPVVGDYDGDGTTDVAVFRPSTNQWMIRLSGSGAARVDDFGLSGDLPMVMDHDGDGKDNIAVFRPGTNTWYLARNSGVPAQNFEAVPFGLAGDKPVPADYDGDRKTDIAVYRPGNGFWYILRSSNGSVDYVPFGNSTDVPVPGDYDGDGKEDVAIYRNGQWWINRSTSGLLVTSFGTATDIPIPKRYVP